MDHSMERKISREDIEEDETNELDLSDEEIEQETPDTEKKNKKLEEQKKLWKEGGWKMCPRERNHFGPRLNMDMTDMKKEIDFFMLFLPTEYIRDAVVGLPSTNQYAMSCTPYWQPLSEEELFKVFGMIHAMEVYKLPVRRKYWDTDENKPSSILRPLNFGKVPGNDKNKI